MSPAAVHMGAGRPEGDDEEEGQHLELVPLVAAQQTMGQPEHQHTVVDMSEDDPHPSAEEQQPRTKPTGVFFLMSGVVALCVCVVATQQWHPDLAELINSRVEDLHQMPAGNSGHHGDKSSSRGMAKAPWEPRTQPLVIAHRGASGLYPEHTREAYLAAIEQGADVIECDVVLTKDLVGVCRHEPNVLNSTNAAQLFPDRLTTKVIDGENITGIFTSDLTLSEVRQLRAAQPWPFRDQSYNYQFPLVTLDEYLDIALSAPRTVGIYPETKHPTWHNSLAQVVEARTSIEQVLLQALEARGYVGPINSPEWLKQPAYIQSFETGSLRTIAHSSCLPLIQLLGGELSERQPDGKTVQQMLEPQSLKELSGFVAGLAPGKQLLVKWQTDARKEGGGAYVSSGIVETIHAAGMQVHTYTLRKEPWFILPHLSSTQAELDLLFVTLGIEGAFNDYAGDMVAYFQQEDPQQWDMKLANQVKPCPSFSPTSRQAGAPAQRQPHVKQAAPVAAAPTPRRPLRALAAANAAAAPVLVRI